MQTQVGERPSHVAAAPDRRALREDVSIGLLGGFEVRDGNRLVDLSMAAQRVVVFLALHRRPLTRSYVSQALWLEAATESRAGGNLRYALWTIGPLQASLIDKTPGHLALRPGLHVDFHRSAALATRLQSDPGSVEESELREEMLLEDLLPDWHEEWVLREQELYRQLRLHALESLCLRLSSLGRFGPAIRAGLAAVAGDPFRERANLLLIRAYLGEGNVGEARRRYRIFETLLRDELGVAPSPAFREALQNLKATNASLTPGRHPAGMGIPSRREGILIIRVWFEGDPPTELRARLVEVAEHIRGESTVAVVATAEDLSAAVRAWVEPLTPR